RASPWPSSVPASSARAPRRTEMLGAWRPRLLGARSAVGHERISRFHRSSHWARLSLTAFQSGRRTVLTVCGPLGTILAISGDRTAFWLTGDTKMLFVVAA